MKTRSGGSSNNLTPVISSSNKLLLVISLAIALMAINVISLHGQTSWQVQLKASSSNLSDIYNYFGAKSGASDCEDSEDAPEPPPGQDYIRLYFNLPDKCNNSDKYTKDIRAPLQSDTTSWNFVISTSLGQGNEITVSWPDISGVPSDYSLTLEDTLANVQVDMRSQASYSYDTDESEETRTFSILVTKDTNEPPTASFDYSPSSPTANETITFDASGSSDPDGSIDTYKWDWTNDGSYEDTTSSASIEHSYDNAGTYEVKLQVVDNDGATDTSTEELNITPEETSAKFRVDKQGNVYADSSYYGEDFVTGNADLAEKVKVTDKVEPGDVLSLNTDNPNQYHKSQKPYSSLAAGVVSTDPGMTLGTNHQKAKATIALLGTVPVKATTQNGPIHPGDLLTTSSKPGYAMVCKERSKCSGAIIGKALASLEEGEGKVRMLVVK